MEEGAGMAARRLHPQIHAREQGAAMTRRLHPEIREEGAGMTRRRRTGTSPSALAASLPDSDDMLREILMRLPPQPSSLPRASAVCRRWRGLVIDPKFLRQVCAHHRKPPILGVFERRHHGEEIVFTPMLDPPDRIPPQHFSLGLSGRSYDLLDSRRGLVLIKDMTRAEVVVCDPIAREQHHLAIPSEFKTRSLNGAVLCAAGDQGHMHDGCHSSSFQVVLMSTYNTDNQLLARVYSSETGGWGNVISTPAPPQLGDYPGIPATLVGNALYWVSTRARILEFDLDAQSLAVIVGPPAANNNILCLRHRIIRAEDGALGFAEFTFPHFLMWRRNVNGQGVAKWVPWKTHEMHTILGLPPRIELGWKCLLGYGEDAHVVFLLVGYTVYMVELESMRFSALYEAMYIARCHPFMSFYTPGTAINGGCNGPEMLNDT